MNKDAVLSTLRAAIRFKRVPDRDWLMDMIRNVESGEMTASEAKHCYHREAARHVKSQLWELTDSQFLCGEEYLATKGMPPRPVQSAIGITVAKAGRIVTFFGPSGTGKTTCAIRAATLIATVRNGARIAAIGGMHLSRLTTGDLSKFIDAACESEIVILDDIDKGSKSETRSSAILEILEYRERMKGAGPTIVTTNHVGEQLADKIERQTEGYGLPIVNRMRRGMSVNFGASDSWQEELRSCRLEMAGKIWDKNDREEFLEDFGRLRWRAGE